MINKKKGISTVIATLMLILLTLVLVGIIWTVVKNLVENQTSKTSCIDSLGKVTLNSQYTYYNQTAKEIYFSINIADLDVEKVLASISIEGQRKSFEISYTNQTINNLKIYRSGDNNIYLPGKNGGLTYVYNASAAGFSDAPDKIELAPVINGNQCEVSDSLTDIDRLY